MPKSQYGRKHREARAEMIRHHQPGDPCCLCGHPMWGPTRLIHADHIPGTDEYRGLAHGYPCETCGLTCNQRDGAVRGNRQRGVFRRWDL